MTDDDSDVLRFARGEADPRRFPHAEHVRMGFEMLRRHDFMETAFHYCNALRRMTAKIGKPEVFHYTKTLAFLSLISERMRAGETADFAVFAAANPDLFDKAVLSQWYSPERLSSEAARTTFLLPDLEAS